MEAAKSRTDIFGQIKAAFPKSEIITSRSVMNEISKISMGQGKDAAAGRLIIQILEKNPIRLSKTKKKADDSLLELCGEDSVLITQDKELRRRCAKKGFLSGFIRERRYLMLGR